MREIKSIPSGEIFLLYSSSTGYFPVKIFEFNSGILFPIKGTFPRSNIYYKTPNDQISEANP